MNIGNFEFGWDSRMGPVMSIRYKSKKFDLAFCHRQEDRCIKLFGHTSFLCARCSGILAGLGLVLLFLYLSLPSITVPWVVSVGLMIPLIVDGCTQFVGLRESNNVLRFISGLIFVPGFYLTLGWSI
jgi:uncharacterized membrane protein